MGHGCPNTRHEKIMALGRAETAERGSRDRGSDVITKVFTCRCTTKLRLKNEKKNFEFNAGGEGKPMELLCHKRGDVRETGKTSNESSEEALRTVWIGDSRTLGRPMSRELQ